MKFPCEINVKHIIPAVRAIMVKELNEKYSKSQSEIARLLGLTQPCVYHYLNGKRGEKGCDWIKDTPTFKRILDLAEKVLNSNMTDSQLIKSICAICTEIRPIFIKNLWPDVDPSSFDECGNISNCI